MIIKEIHHAHTRGKTQITNTHTHARAHTHTHTERDIQTYRQTYTLLTNQENFQKPFES
jgi:hypothetical protein